MCSKHRSEHSVRLHFQRISSRFCRPSTLMQAEADPEILEGGAINAEIWQPLKNC